MPGSICCWSPSTPHRFYRIFACATAASAQGKLDAATLRDSEMRLMGMFPAD